MKLWYTKINDTRSYRENDGMGILGVPRVMVNTIGKPLAKAKGITKALKEEEA